WQWIAAATLVIGALGGWAVSHFRQPPADDRAFRLQIDPPEGGQFVLGPNAGGRLIARRPDRHLYGFRQREERAVGPPAGRHKGAADRRNRRRSVSLLVPGQQIPSLFHVKPVEKKFDGMNDRHSELFSGLAG